jgi:UDP:flavonoid glycosyltransferase YjiC (YdhE family)
MLDQFSWAVRISELGAGCAVPATKLTADRLVEILDRLKRDPGLAAKARELGRKIAREDGAAAAVKLIRAMSAGTGEGRRAGK